MAGIRLAALAFAALAFTAVPATAAPKSKVRFDSAALQVTEDQGSATISVTRSTRGQKSTATVRYATVDGTAQAGSDYTPTTGTLTFPVPGKDVKTQTLTFVVPLIDNGTAEAAETVGLTLTPVSGVAGKSAATMTIIDDDGAARISFASAVESAAENSGSVELEVVRLGDVAEPASATYAVSGGSAAAGDYTLSAGTVTFAADDHIETITVGLKDNLVEDPGPRTLEVSLATPSGAELADPSTTTLTIIDDESPAQVRFELGAVSVDEGAGTAQLTITRAGYYLGEDVTVDLAGADGTALAGEDYTAFGETVTLAGPDPEIPGDTGEESVTIDVPVTADTADELAETFTASLSNPSPNAVLGAPASATVTITDDDAPGEEEPPPGEEEPPPPGDGTTPPPGDGTTPPPGGGTTTTPTTGGSTGTPAGGNDQSGDPLALTTKVFKRKLLRKRGLRLRSACSRACTISIRARVRGKKVVRLRKTLPRQAAGASVRTRLRLTRKAVRRLGARKRYRVTVVVTARADDGSTVSVKRKLRVRR